MKLIHYRIISDDVYGEFKFSQKPDIQFSDQPGDIFIEYGIKYLTRGVCVQNSGLIILYKDGQTINTLLHELAHLHDLAQIHPVHGPCFQTAWQEIIDYYNKTFLLTGGCLYVQ